MTREATPAPPRLGLPWEPGDRAPLTGDWWARGLTLAERVAAGAAPEEAQTGTDRTARAVKRLERWREAYPHLPGDALAAQLEDAGLTEPELLALLAEDPASLAARAQRPAWADEVSRIVADMPREAPGLPVDAKGWHDGFAAVVRPFVAAAVKRLEATGALRRAAHLVDAETFLRTFETWLSDQLVAIAAKALVLELNVRRVLSGLQGDDARQRFWSFVRLMTVPDNLAYFLDEYVVLARTMTSLSGFAADAQAEFCERFLADRAAVVEEILGGRDPGRVTEVSFGGGDAHDGGRTVVLLGFANGARLVYKPRPMAVHLRFNDVVGWYNERLPGLGLRRLSVVDRGDHGWIEFAGSEDCADADAARRYFHRTGALLALLYALGGTDFHHENVIAAGDQPVVIDLEALFHAELPEAEGAFSAGTDPAALAHRDSVARIGLLPAVITGPNGDAIDIGGMGADGGFLVPFDSIDWTQAGTDEMRITRTRKVFPGSRNRPRLGGVPLDPCDYLDQLRGGFRDGYRALLANRTALVAEDGPLAGFAGCRNRMVARATRVYMQMLTESYHPDVTRDALDREWIFGLLWALSADDGRIRRLVRHELTDLWNGDVPMFQGTIGGRDLTSGRGELVGDVLAASGWQRALRVVASMSEADLAQQEWIIDATMATRSPMRSADAGIPSLAWQRGRDDDLPVRERARRLAVRVGEALAGSAYSDGRRVGWLGLDLVAGTSWTVNPVGYDLYGGLSGLAVFFAELARVSDEQRFADLARQAVGSVVAQVEVFLRPGFPRAGLTCGGFGGLAGVAYALDSAATLLAEPECAAAVVPVLELLTDLAAADESLDLIGGSAGCLAVAESLVEGYGEAARRLAAMAAQRLVERATPCGPGLAWTTAMTASAPLLGMSHGVSGMAMALLRHAGRTDDRTAARVAYAAMDYERAEFRAAEDNWPDFRLAPTLPWEEAAPDELSFMHAWCHGAPGIGLARAGVPEAMLTPELAGDLLTAVRALARQPVTGNHSLCHGTLGNLELFAQAAGAGVEEAAVAYDRHAESILAQLSRSGPRCGTPRSVATPGLMAGLAGIGHGLLRIAEPERIAPVLLLARQG